MNLVQTILQLTQKKLNNRNKDTFNKIDKKIDEGKNVFISKPKSVRYSNDLKDWKDMDDLSLEAIFSSVDPTEEIYAEDVPSEAISWYYYEPKLKQLTVKFNGGSTEYTYFRVPEEKVKEMEKASSIGKYFMKNIHDQYTANPGHKPAKNKERTDRDKNFYKKMKKYYKRVIKSGKM